MKWISSCLACLLLSHGPSLRAAAAPTLEGTELLASDEDRSAAMVAGIDRFLMREIDRSIERRASLWRRDMTSAGAYLRSVAPQRDHLRNAIGAVDARVPFRSLSYVSSTRDPALVAETDRIRIWAVRWPVFEDVWAEGLVAEPKTPIRARVVALSDADQTPEMLFGLAAGVDPRSQFARRLAESGCQVLVPVLISRSDTFSGSSRLNRFTNQPHREWLYRQAFELGRHVIGYEAQKILAGVDWFEKQNAQGPPVKIGVVGYAEGGLLALHAAALDDRIHATVVSGYFDSRQKVWSEPIYHNVFGLLREFGDAEIASLVAPRALIVEHSESPGIPGPPPPHDGRSGAAPGAGQTPQFATMEAEVGRAGKLMSAPWAGRWIQLVNGSEGSTVAFGSDKTMTLFLEALGALDGSLAEPGTAPVDARREFDSGQRQRAQLDELVQHTQRLMRESESARDRHFLKAVPLRDATAWKETTRPFREELWDTVIGRFPAATQPARPRSRLIESNANWTAYDVTLDVWPDVFAWGALLLPTDLKPGEHRPVVVCQHGLEGLPWDPVIEDPKSDPYRGYKAFASQLARRGFVVFSPHNPYRGHDQFRVLQRKANPLQRSLFSVIVAQHARILEWLGAQPFVDAGRIGFYGISYGGKTAMRVPALLDGYCLSICSADFNEWIRKNATTDAAYSYLFTNEYEMPEWNMGHTLSYAEMAALIAPRPFMVERGHDDGVAPDEWVAHEFARVRRLYVKLGIPERAEIEFFNGPHAINGKGTFDFLQRHLSWPAR
ncbi:MAG: dienelactone hydrolase family protein [Verrucomicrobia bacterium]|nr:dienelactone hydrolase family protein [Verrucomicrobiota bacterium]MBI3868863.1 dienelactone hydrolase family protein [Verrucomicrobiota bacterium]